MHVLRFRNKQNNNIITVMQYANISIIFLSCVQKNLNPDFRQDDNKDFMNPNLKTFNFIKRILYYLEKTWLQVCCL